MTYQSPFITLYEAMQLIAERLEENEKEPLLNHLSQAGRARYWEQLDRSKIELVKALADGKIKSEGQLNIIGDIKEFTHGDKVFEKTRFSKINEFSAIGREWWAAIGLEVEIHWFGCMLKREKSNAEELIRFVRVHKKDISLLWPSPELNPAKTISASRKKCQEWLVSEMNKSPSPRPKAELFADCPYTISERQFDLAFSEAAASAAPEWGKPGRRKNRT